MQLDTLEIEKSINNSYELPNNAIEAIPKPLVTVRTSTYQHVGFIKECIESVLMQKTSFPFEYIIGEDFSTDGTREIVYEYAKKYPDVIRVVTADYNVGMKANGLRCTRKYRGKYIAICEGDDYWTDPYKLQKQIDFLENNPEYSACFHNAEVIYENDKRKPHPFAKLDKDTYTINDIIEKGWFIPTQSMVYRVASFERPSWANHIYNGDFALQLLLADKSPLYCFDEIMSVYRRNALSISKKQIAGFAQIKIIEILCFFNLYTHLKYDELIKKRINNIHQNLYKTLLYGRPSLSKFLSIDFLIFKFKALIKK